MENFDTTEISYRTNADLSDDALNRLAEACWPDDHEPEEYASVLGHSLLYVTAYHGEKLVGFVNIAWDGGEHAFLLDTRVHPEYRRRGIGTEVCKRAVEETRKRGLKWVHVDFEPHLREFYNECGFRPTEAGLVRLK